MEPPMAASRTAPEHSISRAPARSAAREALRALPQVNAVMEREEVRQEAARHGRRLVTALVRERLDALRKRIRSGALDASAARTEVEGLLTWVGNEVRARTASTMDRKSTRLNSSHLGISYAVFCLK